MLHYGISFQIFHLTINERIRLTDIIKTDCVEFSNFLIRIGDETEKIIKDLGYIIIKIPQKIISKSKTLSEFVDEIYNSLETNYNNFEFIINKAILTPRNIFMLI